jgi:hypothetical protein
LDLIQSLIISFYPQGRSFISRELCKKWNWIQPDGKLKEYAARDLLLHLEKKGYITLPPRLRPSNNHRRKANYDIKPQELNETPLFGKITDFDMATLRIELLNCSQHYLWKYLLHHYHYLGCPHLVGEYHRYIVYLENRVVSCLSWNSGAFKVKCRDDYIGWDSNSRKRNLHQVVTNSRFLILPWISIKHLASKILALNLRRLAFDWEHHYHHSIVLAETFVDTQRFKGTCYRASNWCHLGETKGSGKRGNLYYAHGQKKAVFVYPLHIGFQSLLSHDV